MKERDGDRYSKGVKEKEGGLVEISHRGAVDDSRRFYGGCRRDVARLLLFEETLPIGKLIQIGSK